MPINERHNLTQNIHKAKARSKIPRASVVTTDKGLMFSSKTHLILTALFVISEGVSVNIKTLCPSVEYMRRIIRLI